MENSTETRSQITIPPLALPKSGTVEDLSSSQPVPQAPVVIIHYADFLLLERI